MLRCLKTRRQWLIAIMTIINLVIFSSLGCAQVSPKLVSIPPTNFTRALPKGLSQNISLSGFLISRTETTVGEWIEYLSSVAGDTRDWRLRTIHSLDDSSVKELDLAWPVWNISWIEAVQFCNWLSKRDGFQPCYAIDQPKATYFHVVWNKKANGYRLPTVAEWQSVSQMPNRDNASDLLENGWFAENSSNGLPHKVGTKKPNKYGLYDVWGNVAEYCWDYYNEIIVMDSSLKNPDGPKDYTPDADEVYFHEEPHEVRTSVGGYFGSIVAFILANPIRGITVVSTGFIGFRICRNLQ